MKRFRMGEEGEMEHVNMANVLMLLSRGTSGGGGGEAYHGPPQHPGRVFECKTCNRQFPSFQALGGHRASHKKPRHQPGDPHGQLAQQQAALSKPRVHECSICGLEFAIGQALGGHMRRHRAVVADGFSHDAVEKKSGDAGNKRVVCLDLDLNLPPSENSDVEFRTLSFGLGLPMVDCLH